MNTVYLEPTQQSGIALFKRNIKGPVVMLNLLRFKAVADYSQNPEMAQPAPISGEEAYRLYIEQTLPFLKRSGGEILFLGKGGSFLIGPEHEKWDCVMLIKQKSVEDFFAFASNKDYLKVLAHRTASIEDSRLLPLEDQKF